MIEIEKTIHKQALKLDLIQIFCAIPSMKTNDKREVDF